MAPRLVEMGLEVRTKAKNCISRLKPRFETGMKPIRTEGTKAKSRNFRMGAHGQNLLPGIVDDITLNHVVPKLTWRNFPVLGMVSIAWHCAIRNREAYKARLRSQLTEKHLLLKHTPAPGIHALSLYSIRDNVCCELPPIPSLRRGIPEDCQCVTLDGKVYVLGGRSEQLCSVYMLDLAGQRLWTRCASMQKREDFACGALHGKIYVFGGTHHDTPDCGSEVYDPKENMWSWIQDAPSLRFNHLVAAHGEELFVHGGEAFVSWYLDEMDSSRTGKVQHDDDNDLDGSVINDEFSLDIYHTRKNEWRKVQDFENVDGIVFMAQGRLYSMNSRVVYLHDTDSNSWKSLHLHDWTGIGSFVFIPHAALALDDELFAIVQLKRNYLCGTKLFVRTKGLGSETNTISWQIVDYPPFFADWNGRASNYGIYSIEL